MVMDGSSASILQNSIFQNIKANIALGGRGSSDTHIIQNSIYDSSGPGIYLS
jgi:hypothetical protein